MSGANRNFRGFYQGSGSAQTISECGFAPRFVRVVRESDGASVELMSGEESVAAQAGGLAEAPADLDWQTGLTVSSDAVTLSAAGPVLAVEATTATSAGPKQMQSSASPSAGAVRVEYDADGIATLTFNGTDAVTAAAVLVGAHKAHLSAAEGLTMQSTGFQIGTSAFCNQSGVSYRYEAQD